MTSAENSVLEPPNSKFSGGGYPRPPLQGLCFQHLQECSPFTKNPAMALTTDCNTMQRNTIQLKTTKQEITIAYLC